MLRSSLLLIALSCTTGIALAQQFSPFDDATFCFNRGTSGLHQDPSTKRIWGWAVYSLQVEPELLEIIAMDRDLSCASRGSEGTIVPGGSTRNESVLCLGDTVYLGVANALLRSVVPGTWDTIDISFRNREFDITSLSYLPNGMVLAGLRTYYVVSREYQSGIPYTVLDSIEQRFAYVANGQIVGTSAAPRNETPSKLPLLMPDGTTYSGFYVMKGTSAFMYEITPDRNVNVIAMPAPSQTLLQAPTLASAGTEDVLVWFDPSINEQGYRVNGGLFKYHRPTGESVLLKENTTGAYCSWSGDGIALFGANDEITVYRNARIERYRLSQQLKRDVMLCSVYGIVQLSPSLWLCNTSGGMVFFELDPISSVEEHPSPVHKRSISTTDRHVDLRQLGYPEDSQWIATNILGQEVGTCSGFIITLPEQRGLYLLTNGIDRVVVLAE
jgi:hypothetical protein